MSTWWSSVWHRMESGRRRAVAACAATMIVALIGLTHFSAKADDLSRANAGPSAGTKPGAPAQSSSTETVELSDAQLGMISIGAVSEHAFPIQTEAVGNIDFNEDMAAQVFPPYQGRIVKLYAMLGDNVKRGQPLLTIGYKRPDQYDKDDLSFDIMQFLLSENTTTGMVYRDLVQEKHLAVQARAIATFPSGRHPNLMVFFIAPAQGHTMDENRRALDDLLLRFINLPIEEQYLTRAKGQMRAGFLRRIAANDAMAVLLADYHANYGDWRRMFTSLDDLAKVTSDTVQRAASRYLVATGRTIAYTVAPGQANLPPPAPAAQPERRPGGRQ